MLYAIASNSSSSAASGEPPAAADAAGALLLVVVLLGLDALAAAAAAVAETPPMRLAMLAERRVDRTNTSSISASWLGSARLLLLLLSSAPLSAASAGIDCLSSLTLQKAFVR
jgi:hypothetical protein